MMLEPTPPSFTPSSELLARIENNFTYHAPHGTQHARYVRIRSAARELAVLIAQSGKETRELELSLTSLEQSVFWANANIARHG